MTVGILDRSEKVDIPVEEEPVQLRCLICRGETRGNDAMRVHLVARHKISKRQAGFLARKIMEWKKESPAFTMLFRNRQNT